jgi:malonate transporter and related proteins
LILSHVGLFLIAWIALRQVASLRGAASITYSLMLATSATPVFGLAVLEPILGASSASAVGLVALAINLTIPLAIVLLEMDAATRNRVAGTTTTSTSNPVITGLKAGLKSPLLWGPLLGIAVVVAKIHVSSVVSSSLELIGSATSGVAVFSVGLVLAAHPVRLSAGVLAGSLARVAVQAAMLFSLAPMLQLTSLMEQQTWASSSGAVTGSPTCAAAPRRHRFATKSLIVGHITDQIELPLNRLTTSHIVKYS